MVTPHIYWDASAGQIYMGTGGGAALRQIGSAGVQINPNSMNALKYKEIVRIGDKIRTNGDGSKVDTSWRELEIIKITQSSFHGKSTDDRGHTDWYVDFKDGITVELLTPSTTNPTTQMANLTMLEKAALTFKSEPAKSFRKAGVTNGDDMLTTEGQTIFLTWLLSQPIAKDFKEQVVDPLLKEKEE